MLQSLQKNDTYCVYVSLTTPYNNCCKSPNGRMLCIDCCTLIQQSAPLRAGDVIFVSPRSLTYLSLAVTTSLETIPKGKHKVLVMDMLSTLLLYNDEKLILQFMHSLIGRLRQWDVQTLILTLAEDTSPKMLAQIGSFCDRTVRLS